MASAPKITRYDRLHQAGMVEAMVARTPSTRVPPSDRLELTVQPMEAWRSVRCFPDPASAITESGERFRWLRISDSDPSRLMCSVIC